jgi:hypothetical protein
MKNLVVFITPQKKFFGEYVQLVKVLIDNSLDLGWKPEDILLVTNFSFRYNGVKSTRVHNENYCACRPRSIKTSVIPHLIDRGIVKKGEIYWNHDLDAFQMNSFKEEDLGLESVDMGLTDYGWKKRWCFGSYFFKESAKDIFELTCPIIHSDIEDEEAIQKLQNDNINSFNERHKRLNITYNFGMRKVEDNYQRAEKPIKVVHFHPTYKLVRTWDVFVLGKNGLNMPLVNERLIGVFKQNGINGIR